MIRINRTHLAALALKQFAYFESQFLHRLDTYILKEQDIARKHFLNDLKRMRKDLIIARPDHLERIRKYLESNHSTVFDQICKTKVSKEAKAKVYADWGKPKKKKGRQQNKSYNSVSPEQEFNAKLGAIFNYEYYPDNFTKSKEIWGAYELAQNLGVTVCPYCNRQFISTIVPILGNGGRTKFGGTRPQFDHFYSKSQYPYFALSFFNLVPSCSVCNASLKHTREFTFDTHLHPYHEGFDDNIVFSVKINDLIDKDYLSAWYTNPDAFSIEIKIVSKDMDFVSRADRNIKVFRLYDLYNQHKDYVIEMLVKAEMYNETSIDRIHRALPRLFSTREEVVRLITSNYVALQDLDKRPLAKLTRDISKEYKIR